MSGDILEEILSLHFPDQTVGYIACVYAAPTPFHNTFVQAKNLSTDGCVPIIVDEVRENIKYKINISRDAELMSIVDIEGSGTYEAWCPRPDPSLDEVRLNLSE